MRALMITLFTAAAMSLFIPACATEENAAGPVETKYENLEERAERAYEATTDETERLADEADQAWNNVRDTMAEDLRALRNASQAQLESWEANVESLGDDISEESREAMAELKREIAETEAELDELARATEENWNELKADTEEAMNDLARAFEAAKRELK